MPKRGKDIKLVEPVPRIWEEKPELRGNQLDYPPETKLRAIMLIAQKGTSAAAKETGVALRTVQGWAVEHKDEIAMIRAAEFTEEIDQKIRDILKEIKPEKIKNASFRDLLVGLGIAIDKRQQLLGPQKSKEAPQRLRIAWKSGEGAVEVETK